MIKVFYPTGSVITIKGDYFIRNNCSVDIFNKDNKLIASFYKLEGMGVLQIDDKEVDKNVIQ